mmetsp:Transcript_114738/g.244825  ORF Transcript_114738/g.244825 Transcript_114738/m.244825 type:complete len:124 (+) Transcript_114738:928-1299(+)
MQYLFSFGGPTHELGFCLLFLSSSCILRCSSYQCQVGLYWTFKNVAIASPGSALCNTFRPFALVLCLEGAGMTSFDGSQVVEFSMRSGCFVSLGFRFPNILDDIGGMMCWCQLGCRKESLRSL